MNDFVVDLVDVMQFALCSDLVVVEVAVVVVVGGGGGCCLSGKSLLKIDTDGLFSDDNLLGVPTEALLNFGEPFS